MTSTIREEEKWRDGGFVGVIKKYKEPEYDPNKVVENLDDYDMRKGLGSRFHTFRSSFDRQEC